METTRLLYLEENELLKTEAKVLRVELENERIALILNQTVLYAQGGGQPADTGIIESKDASFQVEDVRFNEGIIRHYGTFIHGTFTEGETVWCQVDPATRTRNSRMHSAGHIIDFAVRELALPWKAIKGFHFASGAYVEYAVDVLPDNKEAVSSDIECTANKIIQQDLKVSMLFMNREEMAEVCDIVPEHLPSGKPGRVVIFGERGIPCGGTHVRHLLEIGKVHIRKLKASDGNIRVSYEML